MSRVQFILKDLPSHGFSGLIIMTPILLEQGLDWLCQCLEGASVLPEQGSTELPLLGRGTASPSHSPEQNLERCLLTHCTL